MSIKRYPPILKSTAPTPFSGYMASLCQSYSVPEADSRYIKECWNTLDYAYGATVSADGHIYSLPSSNAGIASNVYYFNQKWLDNVGAKTPTTLEELYTGLSSSLQRTATVTERSATKSA